jgi:UDP-N-acetylmuramoyl-tripeptide--D-alanyl-D-alanine ligase
VIELTLAEVAAAVGGRLHRCTGSEVVTGTVEYDSRKVTPGGLFVALPGERVDGHSFATAAVDAGAVAVLAGREVEAPAVIVPPVDAASNRAYVLAGDTDGSGAAVLAGLGALARHVLDRLPGLAVVGVTGSSGKTSTKDLIAALLTPLGPTIAPPGSFNNELGHPWTALRADHTTKHLVLELSARGPGHIAALCRVAPPTIGVVVNVGSAHLGEFGSREAIAQAKGELVEALPADGLAVLNADDAAVCAMAARTKARVVFVGRAEHAEVRAAGVTVDAEGRARFELVTPQGSAPVQLAVHGEHQVGNALSAAAVALELGATVDHVASGLAQAKPVSRWRMEVSRRPDGVTIVNDAYNANPESVAAALRALVTMTPDGATSWAVLGPLGELGESSDEEHAEVGRLVARLGVHRLVAIGEEARPLYNGARVSDVQSPDGQGSRGQGSGVQDSGLGEESVLVPDVEAAVALLRERVRPGDVVLVKASRVYGLERVAAALLQEFPR